MKISVYITSYNQMELLREAIESVLAQTLPPYEIVVIDDGSEDRSQEMILSYAQRYPDLIRPTFHAHNRGVTRTRNHALSLVTGDFVTYLDGDDKYLPTKLEREAAALKENPWAQIAYSNYYICHGQDPFQRELWIAGDYVPPEGHNLGHVFGRSFPHRTIYKMELVERPFWQKVGLFDTDLNLWEDFDMRIRMAKSGKAVYVDEPLAEYYRRNSGLSSAPLTHHLQSLRYIYEKHSKLLTMLPVDERGKAEQELTSFMVKLAWQAVRRLPSERVLQAQVRIQLMRFFFWHRRHQPRALDPEFLLMTLIPQRYHRNLEQKIRHIERVHA